MRENIESGIPGRIKRITISLPVGLDIALELYSSAMDRKKAEVFAAAIFMHLSEYREELADAQRLSSASIAHLFK